MKYHSLNYRALPVSFKDAVLKGLAPDRGLYFPEQVKPLPPKFFKNLKKMTPEEMAWEVIKPFVGRTIPKQELLKILSETLNFEFPLVSLDQNTWVLELFHGPTLAFKDVGARFMARCLGYFNRQNNKNQVTVLVATSGDTGGAVANGFFKIPGVRVVILYPSNRISDIQEKQLTTLGNNITAIEVDGNFDECQQMVKTAFLDEDLKAKNLTSANSINVARWLPQMFYYFLAFRQLPEGIEKVVFSVPSGNFGNIGAALVAQQMGLPITHLVAATNANKTVPEFLQTGSYEPRTSVPTISNAMDVGDPSNFVRIRKLMNNDIYKLKSVFSSYSFNDKETRKAMKSILKQYNYLADPHGAVGYLGLEKFRSQNEDYAGVFLETAHPVKFLDVVRKTLGRTLEIPPEIQSLIEKTKKSIPVKTYKELKDILLLD